MFRQTMIYELKTFVSKHLVDKIRLGTVLDDTKLCLDPNVLDDIILGIIH